MVLVGAHGGVYCHHSAEATDGFGTFSAELTCDNFIYNFSVDINEMTLSRPFHYRYGDQVSVNQSKKCDSSQYKVVSQQKIDCK